MSLVYVTGPTGAGKSTVKVRLVELGYAAYDVDDEGMRERMDADSGKAILTLSNEIIKKLQQESRTQEVYLCGTDVRDMEYIDIFDKVIVLLLDAKTQRQRIETRTNNQYGKEAHQMMAAQKWREAQIEKYQSAGAIAIDATKPLDNIVQEILAMTTK